MYGAVVERGIIRAADQKKYIVETLDRKGIESLQITALNGAPFAVGDIVYFFLFPDGTGKIICSEAANDTTGFVVDANYVHTDNNYTNDEKAKLSDIEAEAQKNVQSDWNAESGDAFIKNKPTIPEKVSELENDSGFVNSTEAAAAAPVRSVNGQTGDVDIPTVTLPMAVSEGGTGADNAADARENLAVLPLAGGTVTGQVKSTYANADGFLIEHGAANKDACFRATRRDTGVSVIMGVGAGGTNHGIYSYKLGKWLIYGDGSNVYCNGTSTNVTGTVAVTHGGTGATTAAGARANLGVPTLLDVYPVGSIYMSVNSTSPATLFGGTWEQLKDRFLLAAGSTYSAGGTGGSATMAHTHTISHTHNLDSNGYAKMTLYSSGGDVSYREKSGVTAWTANFRVTGSGGAGSSTSLSSTYGAELGGRTAGSSAANTGAASNTDNMPPYLTVYMWKRTK